MYAEPMPTGLRRIHNRGDTHFITFSCFDRRQYLNNPASRNLVEDALERTRKRYDFIVFGYVIMPEHVHCLIGEPAVGTIADVMKSWKLSVTLRQETRPFWEERYYDFNIFTNAKLYEKRRYLHRNPVRRGLVEKPEDWPWSSFDHFATGVRRVVEVESQWTVRLREQSPQPSPGSENPDPGHPDS